MNPLQSQTDNNCCRKLNIKGNGTSDFEVKSNDTLDTHKLWIYYKVLLENTFFEVRVEGVELQNHTRLRHIQGIPINP